MGAQYDEIRRRLEAGQTNQAIARDLKVCRNRVARIRSDLGIPGWFTAPDSETCRHGHPYAQYLGYTKEGWRYCRKCANDKTIRLRKNSGGGRGSHEELHDGHEVQATVSGRRVCLTCRRGDLDVDEIAVVRAVEGDCPERLSIAERELAVLTLRERGLPAVQISDRVRCTPRTVYRIYARRQGDQRDSLDRKGWLHAA